MMKRSPVRGQSTDVDRGSEVCRYCAVRHSAFCGRLDPAVRGRLTALAGTRHLPKGAVIAWDGADNIDLLTVIEGVVMLSKFLPGGRRQVVGFRFPGDLVTIGNCRTWSATATAVTDCVFCHIDCFTLQSVVMDHPDVGLALLDAAGEEIAEQEEHLLTVGRKNAEERVASFVLDVGERTNREVFGNYEITLPMHRPEIADYLGIETETISRILSRWKKQALIDLPSPSRIVLRNRVALAALAAGRRLPEQTPS